MVKKIIVTGGAGFIGSVLVARLNSLGYDNIIVVDDLDALKWKNLVGKKFDDILHKDHLFSYLVGKEKDISAIFHLGACSDTTMSDANYLLENNYRYSRHLALFAIPHGIRFIYASSAATYGDGALGFSDDHEDLEKYLPLNMYGYSKHLFDLWLKKEGYLDKVVGLKYFNVYGPNEYHKGKMSSAIVKMVSDSQKKGVISLFKSKNPFYKDGEQLRDFIYVKDAVEMSVEFLFNKATGIYNIASGKERSWNQLASAVIRSLKKKIDIAYIDMPDELIGKYQYRTLGEMKKMQEKGLYLSRYSLEEGVEDYVSYLIDGRHL